MREYKNRKGEVKRRYHYLWFVDNFKLKNESLQSLMGTTPKLRLREHSEYFGKQDIEPRIVPSDTRQFQFKKKKTRENHRAKSKGGVRYTIL